MPPRPSRLLALVLATSGVAFAQPDAAPPPARGEVLSRVACIADPAQSYALYVPSHYDPARPWPVVYGFDPSARGAFVVERFRDAAERLGFIVAVSNNARNGPPAPNIAAANAMFRDTRARLAIDRRRIVLAGCSGGGGLALALAEQIDVHGVIVCGAPCEPGNEPRPRSAAIYGTAGIDDFNYPAMRRLDRAFAAQAIPHRLVIVDTDHAWLPAAEAGEALLWMEIQAMRRGLRERDEALLAATFARRFDDALALPVPERLLGMRSLAADFDGLLDTQRAIQAADAIAGHRDVRAWEKLERATEARQGDETTELLEYAAAGATEEVEARLADLKRTAAQTKNARERHLARRILGGASIGAMETGRSALAQGELRLAVRMFELRTWIVDDDARAHFDLARAQARNRARGPAISALTRAAALGLDVAARTRGDSDFDLLRDEPAFQRLVAMPPQPRP